MIQGFYHSPLGLAGLYLIILCPFYVPTGKHINKSAGQRSCCYAYFTKCCLFVLYLHTSNMIKLPYPVIDVIYTRCHKIKYSAKSLWHFSGLRHCYGLCSWCERPCFLDWQLWDITVTIKKKTKWQEHPLVCMHAQEWTALSLRVCPCLQHIRAHRSFIMNNWLVFVAKRDQRQEAVQKPATTLTDV